MSGLSICAVIPTLNEEEYIVQCIKTLQQQDVKRIIVVDGGSTDNTVKLASKLEVEVLLSNSAGRGEQLCRGAQSADCDIVWMVHADCKVNDAAAVAIREAVSGGAGWGAFAIRHEPPKDSAKWLRWCLGVADKRSRRSYSPYGDQALFVRRALLEQVGGVPRQPLFEDLELSKKLNKIMRPVLLEQEIIASSRRFVRRPLKTFVAWMLFPSLYRMKASPQRLMRWYAR
ncbi:MAG: rSAM/selenodomain-associated transferase 2 [Myxococcota bacterium]|jgi:rSAM/selenodomain-associated transferase 2